MKAATGIAFLLAFLTFLCLPITAEEEAAPDEDKGKREEAKEKPATPLSKLLKELKVLVAREEAEPEHDEGLLKEILRMIKSYEKPENTQVKLDDLSDEDRKRLREEMREEIAEEYRKNRDGEGGDGEGGDWAARQAQRRVERALEGVTLSDKQRPKVEELLGEFGKDSATAYTNRDYGLVNDLKKDLEKSLRRVVGNKKARDIINNVNRNLPGRRWGR